MYVDDLLLISSTCSYLRRLECCGRYLASLRHIIPSLVIPQYFSDTGISRVSNTNSHDMITRDHAISNSTELHRKSSVLRRRSNGLTAVASLHQMQQTCLCIHPFHAFLFLSWATTSTMRYRSADHTSHACVFCTSSLFLL